MNRPIISVVLGTYNRLEFLKLTIESIRQELKNFMHEIIVIDGSSNDGTLDWLIKQKDIITIIQHNRGNWNGKKIEQKSWGYFMNLGFKCAQGKYVCMLSDDCLVIPGAILNGYDFFEKELTSKNPVGAVAFYFRDWSVNKNYHVGTPLGNKMYVNHGLFLKKALEDVNYIDEETYKFYTADIDLCFKLFQKNYQCLTSENSYIEHYPHSNLKTRNSNQSLGSKDLIAFREKWQKIFTEIDNHNVGYIKEKEYFDTLFTGKKFEFLHQQILKKDAKFFTEPTFFKKIYMTIRWKLKMIYKKFKKSKINR
jgi:glycosyltransferase involved in cell wall biosynthesis